MARSMPSTMRCSPQSESNSSNGPFRVSSASNCLACRLEPFVLQRRRAAILFSLITTSLCARQVTSTPGPTPSLVIVRVARGSSGGMSGSYNLTVIEPGFIRWESHRAYDWTVKGYPGGWREMQKSPNKTGKNCETSSTRRHSQPLRAERVARPALIRRKPGDGSKKIASYGFSNPPAPKHRWNSSP